MAVSLNGIDAGDVSGLSPGPAGKTQAPPKPQSTIANPAPASPGQSDAVEITGAAVQLAQLEKSLSAAPAIDPARVQAVSHALAAGTYKIQADKVAAGIMRSDQALSALPTDEG